MYLTLILRSLLVLFLTCGPALVAWSLEQPESRLQEAGIHPVLGTKLDAGLQFSDSSGKVVTLADVFSRERPIILVPVYYDCPRLCGLLLDGVVKLLKRLTLSLGRDFELVTVSFDPTESTDLAARRKSEYFSRAKISEEQKEYWHFWTGSKESIDPLMQGLGFKFFEDQGEFAHSAAIFIITPDGGLSQAFVNVEFSPLDVRLALVEASEGKIGTPLDHIMLFCFRFDPTRGKYTWAVLSLLKIVGFLTLVGLGVLFYRISRKSNSTL